MSDPLAARAGDASFPCTQCGSAVPANAPFCLACGTPVSSRTRASALGLTPSAAGVLGAAGAAEPAGSGAGVPGADAAPTSDWRPTPVVPPLQAANLVSANYGRRVLAYLIDSAFTTVVAGVTVAIVALAGGFTPARPGAIAITGWSFVIVVGGALLYPLVGLLMQAFVGYTFGKRMLGLRLVRSDSFGAPGLLRMIVRALIVAAAGLVLAVGRLVLYLSPLWDPTGLNRGWHDRIAKTWVIDVLRGPDPLRIGAGEIVGSVPSPGRPAADTPRLAAPANPPAPTGPPALAGPPATVGAATATAPAGPPAPATVQAPIISEVPGFAPPAPAPVPTPMPPSEASPALDAAPGAATPADEPDVDSTRLSPTPAPREATFALRLDSGELLTLDRAGVLGRDPVSPTGDPDALLLRITGDSASVSKTHLDVDPAPWISDRGSTNGTRLERGGTVTLLAPGARTGLRSGDTVRVGTRSFTVLEVPAR